MADWPPVIDADGHVLERQSDIRKYLEPPWNRRNTGLWPSDQPFDTDLFDTLGYRGYVAGHEPGGAGRRLAQNHGAGRASSTRYASRPSWAASQSCASTPSPSPLPRDQ